MLRYGDGTPFPFDDAFLDMLGDAVEACTTMLAATARLERQRADAEAVLQAIGEEERQLVMFERAVAAACGPAPDRKSTPAMHAAELTRSAMESAVLRSREHLKQISALEASPPSWTPTAQRVHAAAARFFAGRLLPGTRWAWEWDVTGPAPRAEATAQDARFQIVFDLEVPQTFRAPVRIDALVPDLIVHLPRRRLFRAPIETAIPLGRCLLVAAHHDGRGRELTIQKPDGSGWRIELPQDSQPSATALDRRGRAAGTGLVSEAELAPLLTALDRELATPRLPRHARAVLLDGTPITDLADTTLAARALLDALGPTVRAIRERSRTPGELSLKRDIGDGIREELYVSRTTLTARYSDLPAELRLLLDDAGFGGRFTTGVAERDLATQPSQPAIHAPQPSPPSPPSPRLARGSSPPPAHAASPAPAHLTSPAPSARRSARADSPGRSVTTLHRVLPAPAAPRRRRHETQPLLAATPPRPSAVPVPIDPLPSQPATARPDPEQGRRRRDQPTIRSILAVPARVPIRRLLTPT
jgi:hypothetical protein